MQSRFFQHHRQGGAVYIFDVYGCTVCVSLVWLHGHEINVIVAVTAWQRSSAVRCGALIVLSSIMIQILSLPRGGSVSAAAEERRQICVKCTIFLVLVQKCSKICCDYSVSGSECVQRTSKRL